MGIYVSTASMSVSYVSIYVECVSVTIMQFIYSNGVSMSILCPGMSVSMSKFI
jgi:hypothetical protein